MKMKKNKFLTAFAIAMLGASAGFSSEFKDVGYDPTIVTPKKVERERVEVVCGEDSITVTPTTARSITEAQAKLLKTPQIEEKVKASLADKRMHRGVYDLAFQYGVDEARDERDAENERLRQIALKKQTEISQEDARYKMLLSVRKHTKAYAAEIEALSMTLESYQQAGREQNALSQGLSRKIDELTQEIQKSTIEHEHEKRGLEEELSNTKDTSTGREELHMTRIMKLEAMRKKLHEEYRAAEAEKQALAATVAILNERLEHQRTLAGKNTQILSALPIKFSLSTVNSVTDQDEESGEPSLFGDNVAKETASNSSATAVIPAGELKPKKKVSLRAKTNLDAEGDDA